MHLLKRNYINYLRKSLNYLVVFNFFNDFSKNFLSFSCKKMALDKRAIMMRKKKIENQFLIKNYQDALILVHKSIKPQIIRSCSIK